MSHKYKHLGHGMCRGARWTDRVWPIMRGARSLQGCADSCGRTRGCTAFDISEVGNPLAVTLFQILYLILDVQGHDCMLYGHKHPVPAPGVPGECYTVPGAAYVEEVHREAAESAVRRPSIMQEEEEEDTGVGEKIDTTTTYLHLGYQYFIFQRK